MEGSSLPHQQLAQLLTQLESPSKTERTHAETTLSSSNPDQLSQALLSLANDLQTPLDMQTRAIIYMKNQMLPKILKSKE